MWIFIYFLVKSFYRFLIILQLKRLTLYWGWDGLFDANGPINIIKEGPTEHYMMDNKQLVPIPERKIIARIRQKYVALYATDSMPESFDDLFGGIPDAGWTYVLLPLDIDPYKRISRHQTRRNSDGTCESTGKYQDHRYPYPNLSFQTHAHPLCAIWHAGVELDKIPGDRLREIIQKLKDTGATDLADSIDDIIDLYDHWSLPNSRQPIAEGAPTVFPHHQDDSDVEVQDDQDVFGSGSAETPEFEEPEDGFDKADSLDDSIPDMGSDRDPRTSSAASAASPLHNDHRTISDIPVAPAQQYAIPRGTISESSLKRKKQSISPPDGLLPVADNSPRPHVSQKARLFQAGPIPFASPPSPTPARSEGGSRSTKSAQGPLQRPLPAPVQPGRATYEKTGITSGRGEFNSQSRSISSSQRNRNTDPQASGGRADAPPGAASSNIMPPPGGAGASKLSFRPPSESRIPRPSASASGSNPSSSSTRLAPGELGNERGKQLKDVIARRDAQERE
ncbi:hypothetical protein B0H19DRAFT_221385 [Mycena capillaripes]|nr:hypothetical protein B0H19DRAFT_221385 [Mycena capillaripes]